MNQKTLLDTNWAGERSKALTCAGEGIIEARRLHNQLVEFLRDNVKGTLPDAWDVIHACHQLEEAKNTILIGLIESILVPTETQNPTTFAWRRNGEKEEGSPNDKK